MTLPAALFVVCAAFLSSAMGYIHLPQDLAAAIAGLELGPFGLMLILTLVAVAYLLAR